MMASTSTAGWTLFALSVTGMIISMITPGHDEVDEWLMDGGGAVALIGMAMIGRKPFKQPARRSPMASAIINFDEVRKSKRRERNSAGTRPS
jgi:hypothetical protein